MNKIEVFKEELKLIKNENIRKYTEIMIEKLPDYFFTVAAAVKAEHHPDYAHGDGGLLRHTRANVRLASELIRVEMFKYSSDEKDLILTALILHDGFKRGVDGKKNAEEHPNLMADFILKEESELISKEYKELLASMVRSHMGQWNISYNTREQIMPKPASKLQNFVHMIDYIISRRCIIMDFDKELSSDD